MDQKGKRLFIIAFIFILIFLGIAGYLIFSRQSSQLNPDFSDPNLFPFADQNNISQDLIPVESTDDPFESADIIFLGDPEYDNVRNRLRKITSFPVSGFVSFLKPVLRQVSVFNEQTGVNQQVTQTVSEHTIRYNDQRTGHFFEGVITDENIINKKITQTNLPSAEELIFNTSGTIGIIRYELGNSIESFKINLPEPVVPPTYCIPHFTSATIGSKGENVRNIQTFLKEQLKTTGNPDGLFGNGTATQVKTYQELNNLVVNGIVDNETLLFMNTSCENIRSYYTELQNTPQEITGSSLSGFITQLTRNITNNQIFSLLKNREDSTVQGILENFNTNQRIQIFSSPFTEWLPQFVSNSMITLTTYAAGNYEGYTYVLNPNSTAFRKILGPINGLTTLMSPDETNILTSSWENNQLVTRIININNNQSTIVPFTTLSEKCTWYTADEIICGVPQALGTYIYPDTWYKGIARFADSLQKYTISTGQVETLAVFPEAVDVFRISADTKNEYVFFMDKNSYHLWSYRVSGID